jgi:transposase-like protein
MIMPVCGLLGWLSLVVFPGRDVSSICSRMPKPMCRIKTCNLKWLKTRVRGTIFNAPDRATAQAYLTKTILKYEKNASRLSNWMVSNLPEGLMVFSFPRGFRKLLRTTNGVERLHPEVRRRARVVSIFPNKASCLRLVSAVLSEISEEWLTGRTYITFESAT